ncbi:alpha/beta fold hydrolase [Geobacillus zalihae]|uniref:Alpha/beta fold hydrolase n=1 Tax=Geobacillus zalihae TaxID=213419 RepID=A0A7H1RWF3_9BACL|nr:MULTISPECIES: alpha/beta fold hydrolase [Geobacillus]OQP12535.1 alpha/beta hydrolase [Geobacillus zalihae]OQP20716.1 alpha/beta hydrolase [Geobacillus zalihae]QNU18592.1 alpha/beta fold hydrolase [Geobacillus zalihae]RXS89075.1 alpha/beta fold hydrolase [Geobacillus sp. PK12]WKA48635.1 alpha/beta fold hydrolase [Geobacillus zalihae]
MKFLQIASGKEFLATSMHYPDSLFPVEEIPIVIICHGFISTRIGIDRLFVQTAHYLASRGMLVVRFDYAGCGESSGEYGDNRLEDLIDQTRSVIDYVKNIESFKNNPIILLGHSLGGAVALLTATIDTRVDSLILWAPSANPYDDITRIVRTQTKISNLDGSIDYCGYRLGSHFFESLSHYHPLQEAKKFPGNVLVVHGTNDEVIPVEYCDSYDQAFKFRKKGNCEKEVIAGANHTFSSLLHRQILLQITSDWLEKELSLIETN